MKLEIVQLWDKTSFDRTLSIEPSNLKRKWMDDTNDEYAYRCLPLNIANQHGWAVYLKTNTIVNWTGDTSSSKDSVQIYENVSGLASSHFGHGILTFSLPFLIRLDPNYSLYITGAPNHHMRGIQPCTGIFEADWATYSFTMNWRFTESNYPVLFTPKDPICFFFPVPRNIVNEAETKYSTLEDQDKEFIERYQQFTDQRTLFNEAPEGWQKHYFQGLYPDGTKCPFDHKTKLKPKDFQ